VRRCTKNYYPDQAAARSGLRAVQAAGKPVQKVPHRVYPCDVCDGWHLTSKNSGRKTPPWDKDPDWARPSLEGLQRRGRSKPMKVRASATPSR
jgi:hypothetical protein